MKDILDFIEQGKFYRYLGETIPTAFIKGKVYRCWYHLPYMAGMSRLGRGIKSPTLGNLFNYPCNKVKNWERIDVKTWNEVRKLETKITNPQQNETTKRKGIG